MLPGRHMLNLGLLLGNVGAMGYYMMSPDELVGMTMLGTTTALSSVMGVTLTAAIGGKPEKSPSQTAYCIRRIGNQS